MPPKLFIAMAAPAAPFVPPPQIHVQPTPMSKHATPQKNNELITEYADDAGDGTAVRGGRVIPPSPPVYLGADSPPYPRAYRNARLRAFVSAVCVVETDGTTDNCNLIDVDGMTGFGQAVLAWLGGGKHRYKPATRNGEPVAQKAALKFYFVPDNAGGL